MDLHPARNRNTIKRQQIMKTAERKNRAMYTNTTFQKISKKPKQDSAPIKAKTNKPKRIISKKEWQ